MCGAKRQKIGVPTKGYKACTVYSLVKISATLVFSAKSRASTPFSWPNLMQYLSRGDTFCHLTWNGSDKLNTRVTHRRNGASDGRYKMWKTLSYGFTVLDVECALACDVRSAYKFARCVECASNVCHSLCRLSRSARAHPLSRTRRTI